MRSHISWRGEQSTPYKGIETSPYQTRFRTLKVKPERKRPKRTIFVNGGLGLLQMVSEPNTRRCASENAGPPRGVNCEVSHRLKRGTKHSLQGCEILSLIDVI